MNKWIVKCICFVLAILPCYLLIDALITLPTLTDGTGYSTFQIVPCALSALALIVGGIIYNDKNKVPVLILTGIFAGLGFALEAFVIVLIFFASFL